MSQSWQMFLLAAVQIALAAAQGGLPPIAPNATNSTLPPPVPSDAPVQSMPPPPPSNNTSGGNPPRVGRTSGVGCLVNTNSDQTGGWAHLATVFNMGSDEECITECGANPQCQYWVRQPTTGICWLGSAVPTSFAPTLDRNSGPRCTSIAKRGSGMRCANFDGYRKFLPGVTSIAECQELCELYSSNGKCPQFSYSDALNTAEPNYCLFSGSPATTTCTIETWPGYSVYDVTYPTVCQAVTGYIAVPDMDHTYDDIVNLGGASVAALAAQCNANPACKAFNTAYGGWLKSQSAVTVSFPGNCLYVKAPTACATGRAVASLGKYPGYPAPGVTGLTVEGAFTVKPAGSLKIRVQGAMRGLEPSSTGTWHIHAGTTCDVAAQVGGHHFPNDVIDTWVSAATAWTSDASGYAQINWVFDRLAFEQAIDHALVIHAAGGTRVACAVIRCETDCPAVTGYVTTPNADAAGNDVLYLPGSSVQAIAAACDRTASCKGFNSNGFAKSVVSPAGFSHSTCLYTKTTMMTLVDVVVGPSGKSSAAVTLFPGLICQTPCGLGCRMNTDEPTNAATFQVQVSGSTVAVVRTDLNAGWTMNLIAPCYTPLLAASNPTAAGSTVAATSQDTTTSTDASSGSDATLYSLLALLVMPAVAVVVLGAHMWRRRQTPTADADPFQEIVIDLAADVECQPVMTVGCPVVQVFADAEGPYPSRICSAPTPAF